MFGLSFSYYQDTVVFGGNSFAKKDGISILSCLFFAILWIYLYAKRNLFQFYTFISKGYWLYTDFDWIYISNGTFYCNHRTANMGNGWRSSTKEKYDIKAFIDRFHPFCIFLTYSNLSVYTHDIHGDIRFFSDFH